MNKWFESVWFVRVVSLAFAILLYVFVNLEGTTQLEAQFIPNGADEVQVLDDVPVDIRIDAERFVVSGVPEFVTVSLEGTSSLLTPIVKQRNFTVFADLEDLEEGEHTIDLEHSGLSSDVSIYIEPKTIEITIEERATEEFPVSADFINRDELPEGYELGEVEINPGSVTITSSKSVIEQISMVKVYIDVAGLTEPINNREVPVNVYDSQGNELNVRVEPETVVVSVDVDNPSKVVPIDVPTTGELPDGYSLTSITPIIDELEIFGTSQTLESLENISTEEIDLSSLNETGKIDVKLIFPEGTNAAEDTIEVTVELEQTKTIEDVSIEVINLQGEQEVSFIEPDEDAMSVTVIGDEKEVRELTMDDFRLFIDVGNLGEGEHDVPVTIESPDQITFNEEFDQVKIEIF